MDTGNKIENNKYYTPETEEFCVGFECEFKSYVNNKEQWDKRIIKIDSFHTNSYEDITYKSNWRVKFLDEEDVLSLGFTKSKKYYESGMIGHNEFIKFDMDNIVKIQTYWGYNKNEREDLIRIFKGIKYNYPYSEIFRGKIKNKIEFKKLLKQLNIDERTN